MDSSAFKAESFQVSREDMPIPRSRLSIDGFCAFDVIISSFSSFLDDGADQLSSSGKGHAYDG